MEAISTAKIPGARESKRRVCYYLPEDLVTDLESLRKNHDVNLSRFAEHALRDAHRKLGKRATQ
jgi:post-segregation antitoxin (ccd killing protein)